MPTPAWPSALPQGTLAAGYGIDSNPSAILRTDMDNGTARVRQRWTKTPEYVSVEWSFTNQQEAIFRAWCRHYLHEGADWFTIPLQTGQTANGQTTCTVRFRDGVPPRARQTRGRWMVSASLEVQSLPEMSKATLDTLLP